jgi:hypothetical protein
MVISIAVIAVLRVLMFSMPSHSRCGFTLAGSPVGQQLTQELGRTPSELDLARYLGASAANLREARLAELAFRPSPLDQPLSGQPGAASPADLLGGEDPRIDHMLRMRGLATHGGELAPA